MVSLRLLVAFNMLIVSCVLGRQVFGFVDEQPIVKQTNIQGPSTSVVLHRDYLKFPVSDSAPSRKITLSINDKTIRQLDLKLAADTNATSSFDLNVRTWIGSTLKISSASDDSPEIKKVFNKISQSNKSSNNVRPQALANSSLNEVSSSKPKISFAFQIQPLLSKKCYACHGPDGHNEESELNLSDRALAIESGAIVAGSADDSELIARIISEDNDTLMPPPESHKTPLSKAEIALVRNWINEGANYEKHWAFTPIIAPPVPRFDAQPNSIQESSASPESVFLRNEIDAFVLRKIKEKDLSPNPDSDPARLVRRLAFDLTGLPPQIDLVRSFVEDSSDENWVRIVDQMLDSDHYGEHWARHWLDAVRYGDTHGIHIDNSRSIWPYRDWVVNAINQNMPFDQFTIEQMAGDMLPGANVSQKVASGYNRCVPTTAEGGSIDAELLVNYANDQTATTFAVWQGLTAGCAACHDHKFDPLSQKEYYQLTAFFRNNTVKAKDGNQPRPPPIIRIPNANQQQQRKALHREKKTLEEALPKLRVEWENSAEARMTDEELFKTVAEVTETASVSTPEQTPVWTFGPEQIAVAIKDKNVKTVDGPFGPALKLNKDSSLLTGTSAVADPETGAQLSFGGHIRLSQDASGTVVSQMYSEKGKRGWELTVNKWEMLFRLVNNSRHCAIEAKIGAKAIKDNKWHHFFITYDGNRPHRQLVVYLDGVPIGYRFGNSSNDWIPPTSSWGTDAKIGFGLRHRKNDDGSLHSIKEGEVLFADFVLFDSAVSARTVRQSALIFAAQTQAPIEPPKAVDAPEESKDADTKTATADRDKAKQKESETADKLTKAEKEAKEKADLIRLQFDDLNSIRRRMLVTTIQRSQHADLFNAQLDLETIKAGLTNIDLDSPVSLIMKEKENSKPKAHILDRGDYASPLEEVGAEVPAVLPPLSPTAPRNRLGLAVWMVSPENPLTARVTVNRYWHHLFGTGIVKSNEDFGITGDQPTHPELLNWLGNDFVKNDWDVKRLIRMMVTSSTYRQSQRFTPEKSQADPSNRFLSRGPRTRLDGEQLRDMALINARLLTDRIGGPPVKPYQPDKVWEEVAMAQSDTRFYRQSFGDQLYRRSLYTFWKRTAAPPSMTILNSPDRSTFCVRREKTNTPLQAFVMWNDPQFVEAARNVAEQAVSKELSFEQSVDFIGHLFVARKFGDAERSYLRSTFDKALSDFSTYPDRAEALLEIGESPLDESLPPEEVAAWTLVTSQIMNLDEALTH